MQNYMLTVVVKNNVDEKARAVILDQIKKQFGNLKKEDLWGTRSLAYQIAHQDKAYFAHYEFEAEPNTIFGLDKSIKLNEDIIRYLLTRVELRKKLIKPKVTNKKEAVKVEEVTKKEVGEEILDEEKKD